MPILDDPTNGLGPYWIAELNKMMAEKRNKGCAVLFSTHLLNFADDGPILHEGYVLATGSMDDVLRANEAVDLEQLWLKKIEERIISNEMEMLHHVVIK
ncbi:hypothetical protein [Sporosarcina sp. P13]|uniref:hypothetical protein n=1 Tax=Sporosarcina sp. P13 TaxID=2048263 RepID=UPI00117A469E|nr:hypothetical protein [Sporosarcina sp. P13]